MSQKRQIVFTDLAPDTEEGEAARLLDPMWLLARQWQMGELHGEDNGTPVCASLDVEAALLCAWHPGTDADTAATICSYDPLARPLEALVEGETWSTESTPHLRLAMETGLLLLELLRASGLHSAAGLMIQRAALVIPAEAGDTAALRLARLHRGRSVNGLRVRRMLEALAAAGDVELTGVFTDLLLGCTDDQAAVKAVLATWQGIWDALPAGQIESQAGNAPAPAWRSQRMEYAFGVAAQMQTGVVGLLAPEYLGGTADWHDFVLGPALALPAAGRGKTKHFEFIPSPVRFAGMPSARYWEFEDGRVNLPRLRNSHARSDPASQLLLDFALRYGCDWFMLPLPLPVGSVSRVQDIAVRDSFGAVIRLPRPVHAQSSTVRGMTLSVPEGNSDAVRAFEDVFLLPPTSDQVLDSTPAEQLRLVRDEMANLAWAIELLVEGPAGQRIDRVEHSARSRAADSPHSSESVQRYRLGTDVPPHWIPLSPEPGHLLRRKALPRFTDHGIQLLHPLGRVLEPGRELVLLDEEVPREGLRVERLYRFARTADGSPTLWMARRKYPGQGEACSGLRFDTVV